MEPEKVKGKYKAEEKKGRKDLKHTVHVNRVGRKAEFLIPDLAALPFRSTKPLLEYSQ